LRRPETAAAISGIVFFSAALETAVRSSVRPVIVITRFTPITPITPIITA
jgi:hypothetical protein